MSSYRGKEKANVIQPEDLAKRMQVLLAAIKRSLETVDNIIVVISGKGGVGKSLISATLAIALNKLGMKVGILDADIHGPSIPWILGVEDKRMDATSDGKIIPLEVNGIKVVSIELALDNKQHPLIFRGPLKSRAIIDLIAMSKWDHLNFLVVDLPPGTGDEALTIIRYLKPKIIGAIVVLVPSLMVKHVITKVKNFLHIMNVPILGIIMNMAYFKCPTCGTKHKIFGDFTNFGSEVMVELPLDTKVAKLVDNGEILSLPENDEFMSKMIYVAKEILSRTGGGRDP
jgi:ATP-binding protein involved in chromosome partitioning